MTGESLTFSIQTSSGMINVADGQRYAFDGSNWRESTPPMCGVAVDFQPQGSTFMMSIIGIVERIIYLSKLDSEFQQIYVLGRKS